MDLNDFRAKLKAGQVILDCGELRVTDATGRLPGPATVHDAEIVQDRATPGRDSQLPIAVRLKPTTWA